MAAAASGKASGFLALDWSAGTPLHALVRRSFQFTPPCHPHRVVQTAAGWSREVTETSPIAGESKLYREFLEEFILRHATQKWLEH